MPRVPEAVRGDGYQVSKLRQSAQGKPCQVRLPGICSHDPEQTVLAHIRRGGVAGVGCRPNDLIAVRACYPCHSEIDRRTRLMSMDELDGYILEAMCRTLDAVVREGLVKF